MPVLYVARSAKLSQWGSDVGLGKNLFKVGVTEEDPAKLAAEGAWAGETDWTIVRKEKVADLSEETVLERLKRRETMAETKYYPRLRDAIGIFKVDQRHVESHIIVGRALDGPGERSPLKVKPADFASYLVRNAQT